ncbi:MAG: L-seryl-tRNA(Sec) selenium transferase, partial [Chloroflexi bacterium]|nr:L-seryl-tRNA(Sec) selenium transferase [Chloroflexota bacterium]
MTVHDQLRSLPSVDVLLQDPALRALIEAHGRELAVEAIRASLADARRSILDGHPAPSPGALLVWIGELVQASVRPTLRPVINATGVVIHTNLGRAPLCAAALEAMVAVGRGYSNLEYDLQAGVRGSRYVHAAHLLCRLTGAA